MVLWGPRHARGVGNTGMSRVLIGEIPREQRWTPVVKKRTGEILKAWQPHGSRQRRCGSEAAVRMTMTMVNLPLERDGSQSFVKLERRPRGQMYKGFMRAGPFSRATVSLRAYGA